MFVILISISPRFGVPYRELEFSGFGESRFMAFSFSLFHFYPFLNKVITRNEGSAPYTANVNMYGTIT